MGRHPVRLTPFSYPICAGVRQVVVRGALGRGGRPQVVAEVLLGGQRSLCILPMIVIYCFVWIVFV